MVAAILLTLAVSLNLACGGATEEKPAPTERPDDGEQDITDDSNSNECSTTDATACNDAGSIDACDGWGPDSSYWGCNDACSEFYCDGYCDGEYDCYGDYYECADCQ